MRADISDESLAHLKEAGEIAAKELLQAMKERQWDMALKLADLWRQTGAKALIISNWNNRPPLD